MADAIIQFTLRGGEDEGGLMHYEPGQRVRGTVQLIPDKATSTASTFPRLQWHTEGRRATNNVLRNSSRPGQHHKPAFLPPTTSRYFAAPAVELRRITSISFGDRSGSARALA